MLPNRRASIIAFAILAFIFVRGSVAQSFVDAPASNFDQQPNYLPASYTKQLAEFEARLRAMEASQPEPTPMTSTVQPTITVVQPQGFFFGGYEHVVVRPFFSRNIAFWNETGGGVVGEFASFDWDMKYTPRIYIGYQSPSGTGIRVTYWSFDGDSRFARTEQPGENLMIETNLADNEALIVDVDGTLLGQHSIKARIFDAEFTKSGNFLWGWLEGSGGLRYARVEQDASWQETGGIEFVVINFDFEGTGPTLALKGGVPLFDSNLSFFAGGRTSLLYGNRSAISSDDTPAGDIITNYDGLLPILEARTGFEWATVIYGYNVFLQAAVEGQTWFRGGAASGGDDEGIPADQLDMGFFGGSFSTIIELR